MQNKKFDLSAASQRVRLLEWLRKKPITTLQARHQLDILGVAPRVYELRHMFGHNIQKHWIEDHNPGGSKHTVAQYVLFPGAWKKGGVQ